MWRKNIGFLGEDSAKMTKNARMMIRGGRKFIKRRFLSIL
jgi:hypothetical protein